MHLDALIQNMLDSIKTYCAAADQGLNNLKKNKVCTPQLSLSSKYNNIEAKLILCASYSTANIHINKAPNKVFHSDIIMIFLIATEHQVPNSTSLSEDKQNCLYIIRAPEKSHLLPIYFQTVAFIHHIHHRITHIYVQQRMYLAFAIF